MAEPKAKDSKRRRLSPVKKKLVVCLDGTWNAYFNHRQDEETNWTNVQKIRTLVAKNNGPNPQIVVYSRGVGTRHLFDKVVGGIFGEGVDEQILDAYMMICDNYNAGDDIYLFGFSRGAVAARAVASMITECGILKKKSQEMIRIVWSYFCASTHERHRDNEQYQRIKAARVGKKPRIKFLGVWDTVFGGSIVKVGAGPLRLSYNFKFDFSRLRFVNDNVISPMIDHAYHALAIDEKRKVFEPIPWKAGLGSSADQTIEQVWFPGSHSNVGGGVQCTGLSDISLNWMIKKAKKAGLKFDDALIKETVKPDIKGDVHDSSRIWDITGIGHREIEADGRAVANEFIHVSALCRYNPGHFKEPHHPYNPLFLERRHNGEGRHAAAHFPRSRVADLQDLDFYRRQLSDRSMRVKLFEDEE